MLTIIITIIKSHSHVPHLAIPVDAGGYAGYAAYATTTRYGDAKAAACGGMHTGALIGGPVERSTGLWDDSQKHGGLLVGGLEHFLFSHILGCFHHPN